MLGFLRFLLSIPIYIVGLLLAHALFLLNYGFDNKITNSFVIGFAVGLILFNFICRFKPVYIFGHELAHWIFAKIFMKETQNFKVGKHGGSVQVRDPNVWVVLAPYFYPTFTVLWLPSWFIFIYFKNDFAYGPEVFFAILGLSWAYHIVLTLFALKFEQSDIEKCGRPLSFSIIFTLNMLFIFVFLSLVTDGLLNGFSIFADTFKEDMSASWNLAKTCLSKIRALF
ncbi:MAG: hypothetical protein NE330_23175 [Lentisphaeraceae bacterium]|nr:hypothetical protein [Lentisphaeraceae bacterium]